MRKFKSTIAILIFLIVAASFKIVIAAEDSPTAAATTRPSTQPTTMPSPESLKALTDIAAKPALLLTHDSKSAHEKFTFSIAINPPADSDSQSTTVLVVRDGKKTGVIVGAKGYPSYYMTQGLFIGMDQKNPGGLIVHEGGSMQVVFGGPDAGKKSRLNYVAAKGQDVITLDPGGMLSSITGNIASSEYRPQSNRLVVKTNEGNRITIKLPRSETQGVYPIESLLFQPAESGGFTFAFGNVQPNVAFKKSITDRTLEDARKLGVPIRILKDEEVEKEFVALARKEFGMSDQEQQTAEKLQGFFPEDIVEKE